MYLVHSFLMLKVGALALIQDALVTKLLKWVHDSSGAGNEEAASYDTDITFSVLVYHNLQCVPFGPVGPSVQHISLTN